MDYITVDGVVSLDQVSLDDIKVFNQDKLISGVLDRIDQRNLPLDNEYTYTSTGKGVYAYILDTGIYAYHQEFRGRIGNGYDFIHNYSHLNDC